MKSFVILDCCSYEIRTCSKNYYYLDCYKLKSGEKFFKRKLQDGREIKKEIMLVSFCPHCNHYIIRFLFYANSKWRFQDWDETKIVRGKKADEIFARRFRLYNKINLPDPFKPVAAPKNSKGLWIYYKMLPEQQAQIPRYFDESGNAGLKISIPLKIYNMDELKI